MTPDTLSRLGSRLIELREAQGWSLCALADAAGLAKSNLSRIERGQANPTIETLWRLAEALGLPFGTLIAPVTATLEDDGIEVQLLARNTTNAPMDLYLMRLAPHRQRHAEPHPPGTRERVTVINGTLTTGNTQESADLQAGEAHHFHADRAHHYVTREDGAEIMVEIRYLRTGAVT